MSDDYFKRYQEIIPDFPGFLQGLSRPLPLHIRVNRLKIDPGLLFQMLKKKGIHPKNTFEKDESLFNAPGLESPGNLLEYFLGYIHPQALTSCIVSHILCPGPGSFVLDMCASPGGKTSHMAEMMSNSGLIVANELNSRRHIPLSHTLSRLGVLNTVVTAYQAQEFPLKHRFDYILADVPCSGEGRFRMTTGLSFYREGKGRKRLSDIQKKIIIRGFDLLRKGGQMVYATCTYNPEENESVVNFLLKKRDAELLPINVELVYDRGVAEWKDERYERQMRRTVRFYPHRVDSVGFFMARIGRRG